MKKFNYDDADWDKYKKPWDDGFNLPEVKLTTKLCSVCKKPLPANRQMFHDSCGNSDDTDSVSISSLYEVHTPTEIVNE